MAAEWVVVRGPGAIGGVPAAASRGTLRGAMIRSDRLVRSVLSLIWLMPLLACDYRAATFDREVDAPREVPHWPPRRYQGPGEAGTPRSLGMGYLQPFSVDGSDREIVRATTERAIACGCDPRMGQHR